MPLRAAARENAGMETKRTHVFIVDDSALIRSVMTEIINSQPDMTVVGTAADPLVARDLIKVTNPDVLTLDVGTSRLAQGPSALTALVEIERWDAPLKPVRAHKPPVFTRIQDNLVLIDPRTLLPGDAEEIEQAMKSLA